MKLNVTIRKKIIIMAVLTTLIPLLIIAIFAGIKTKSTANNHFDRYTKEQIQYFDNGVNMMIESFKQNAKYFVKNPLLQIIDSNTGTNYQKNRSARTVQFNEMGEKEKKLHLLFKRIMNTHPDYGEVFIGTKWGRYASGIIAALPAEYNPKIRPWYNLSMANPNKVVRTDPYMSTTGAATMTYGYPVTINSEKVAVFCMDLSLKKVTDILDKMEIGENGYAVLMGKQNNKSIILANPRNNKDNFKKANELDDKGLISLLNDDIKNNEVNIRGINYRVFIYKDLSKEWKYAALIPVSELYSDVNAMFRAIFITAIILIIIFIGMSLIFAGSINRSIQGVISLIKNIAQGEGDLTLRLPENSNDEIGDLSRWFNIFVEKLHGMISDISEQTHVLSAASEELQLTNANMSENLHGVSNEIKHTDQISQEVGRKTISTAAAVEQASQNINNISSMSQEIKGYYNNLSGNAGALENKVMSVTAAAEEMNATIGEITKNTTEAASISQEANQQAEDTGETMIQLSKMANDINEIVDMIKEVSAQTNLLALNATIEAASAGEAGKGFAVVANEIKNLANQTAEATKNINDQIKGVQKHTNDSVGRIKNIQTVITSLNEINLSIAAALEEQSVTISAISEDMTVTASTTRDTVENVHRVGGQITEMTENIDQATGNIGLIAQDTQGISMSMENITGKISGVSDVTIDNLAGIEEMNQSASELAKMAEHLNQIVGMFKL